MRQALIIAALVLLALAGLLEAQTTGPNDQEIQRFVVPGTNTTAWRVHSSGSVMNLTLAHGAIMFGGRMFSDLPRVIRNGAIIYCINCTIANPCDSGGTGAIAKRLNNVWVCN